jgi:KaiC/GvpD/RAD55 family RecA-like ATPase
MSEVVDADGNVLAFRAASGRRTAVAVASADHDPDFTPEAIAARHEQNATEAERDATLADRADGDPIEKLRGDVESLCKRISLRLEMARRIPDTPGPREIVAELARAAAALEQSSRPRPRVPTVVERARSLGSLGTRLSTGIAAIDEITRGGIPPARLVALGGAPGALKTMLGAQMVRGWVGVGCAVAILASDEHADSLLVRWGQSLGLDRDELERGDERAKEYLARDLAGFEERVALVDGAAIDGDAVNYTLAVLNAMTPLENRPRILLVDSLQTAVAWADGEAPSSKKEKVEAVIAAMLRATRRDGVLAIATSEVNRATYRGGREAGTSLLASAKDSGDVEYKADLYLAMISVRGEHDTVDIAAPKNRLGRSGEETFCRLVLDRARATLSEGTLPASADAVSERTAQRDAVAEKRLLQDAAVVAAALASTPGVTRSELQNLARASAGSISKDRFGVALARLGPALVRVNGERTTTHCFLDGSRLDEAILPFVAMQARATVATSRPPAIAPESAGAS